MSMSTPLECDSSWPPDVPAYRILLPQPVAGNMWRPAVSVVVPTCGRAALLARCLAALEAQERPPGGVEIIVVNDARRQGPAWARNRGWRQARADIIAFTDDDTVPDSHWVVNGLKAFAEGADVVCGRVIMPLPDAPSDYECDAARIETSEFVTANCFIRKNLLEKLGGFDERFKLAWREDSDLHFRILAAGTAIRRSRDALVVHPVRKAGWGVSLSQQRKIMFDALLFKKHRQLYRERIRATPRWDYYAIVATAVLGFAYPPLFLIWLALTARFCAQRLRGTSRSPAHIAEIVVTSIAIPPLAVFWRIVGALKFRVAFS